MKRILTIDGGGIKGTFPASFLASVEETTGKSVANYFDLIVGTPTGGIIALGLGLGMPARDILGFYEEYGPKIFSKPPLRSRLFSAFKAKYEPVMLHQALEERFGDKRIGDSKVRLIIPSVNLETGEVYLYKTAHHSRLKKDYKEKAIEAARATSAAPSYFPSYITSSGLPLLDGGVWANNPMGVAIVEATTVLEWHSSQIQLLSLGCTQEPFKAEKARVKAKGWAYWANNAAELFMSAQSSASSGMAKLLLGGDERIYRINPVVPRGRFKLDNISGIEALRGLGESEARKEIPILEVQFLKFPVDPFEPYYNLLKIK